MLQGDHREDVKSYLVKFGFTESAIESPDRNLSFNYKISSLIMV